VDQHRRTGTAIFQDNKIVNMYPYEVRWVKEGSANNTGSRAGAGAIELGLEARTSFGSANKYIVRCKPQAPECAIMGVVDAMERRAMRGMAERKTSSLSDGFGGINQYDHQGRLLSRGSCKRCRGRSDRRLKLNATYLGTSPLGVPVYLFNYRQGMNTSQPLPLGLYRGTMAQDLLDMPAFRSAVTKNPDGYYRVDYSKLDVNMELVPNSNV